MDGSHYGAQSQPARAETGAAVDRLGRGLSGHLCGAGLRHGRRLCPEPARSLGPGMEEHPGGDGRHPPAVAARCHQGHDGPAAERVRRSRRPALGEPRSEGHSPPALPAHPLRSDPAREIDDPVGAAGQGGRRSARRAARRSSPSAAIRTIRRSSRRSKMPGASWTKSNASTCPASGPGPNMSARCGTTASCRPAPTTDASLDPYALDRQYWQSLWYRK